jgi:mitochondrial inner membrane protease subunit 2
MSPLLRLRRPPRVTSQLKTQISNQHPQAQSQSRQSQPPNANRFFATLRNSSPYIYSFVFTLAFFKYVTDYIVWIPKVIGPSMSPSLSPEYNETGQSDRILLWKFIRSHYADHVKRGAVISFAQPHNPWESSLKRVIGVEGDIVLLDRRRRALRREGKNGADVGWETGDVEAVEVPYGHVWVEGDNWRKSYDSNDFGPISRGLIEGRALKVVWPPSRWGDLKDLRKEGEKTKVIEGKGWMETPLEWS